jgi:hypothetical protein
MDGMERFLACVQSMYVRPVDLPPCSFETAAAARTSSHEFFLPLLLCNPPFPSKQLRRRWSDEVRLELSTAHAIVA